MLALALTGAQQEENYKAFKAKIKSIKGVSNGFR